LRFYQNVHTHHTHHRHTHTHTHTKSREKERAREREKGGEEREKIGRETQKRERKSLSCLLSVSLYLSLLSLSLSLFCILFAGLTLEKTSRWRRGHPQKFGKRNAEQREKVPLLSLVCLSLLPLSSVFCLLTLKKVEERAPPKIREEKRRKERENAPPPHPFSTSGPHQRIKSGGGGKYHSLTVHWHRENQPGSTQHWHQMFTAFTNTQRNY
jgi:hypothetical protein